MASHITHRTEYSDEIETIWVEFKALFDERRKREGRAPTNLYQVISIEMGLGASTIASFYRHQIAPRVTSIDKINSWIERETKRIDREEINN